MLTPAAAPAPSARVSLLLAGGMLAGAALGHASPAAGAALGARVDATLLALVGLLCFGVRFGAIVRAWGSLRVIGLILAANFVLVPFIGYAVASLLLPAHPWLMIGLAIYFMAPCTDWFLGFTRLAGGNVALGAALIPINMAAQIALYPAYLHLFAGHAAQVEPGTLGDALAQGFLAPLAAAVAAHGVLRQWLGAPRFDKLLHALDRATPWVIALLVMEIFAAHVAVMLEHRAVFAWLLLAVFVFFACTFLLGEGLSRLAGLAYPDHALLTMSLAARNAPLMLAVTMAALPGRPLVYAALVIGMLVEFPHLVALRRLLLRRLGRESTAAGLLFIKNKSHL